jgi:hypothetical protein
VSGQGLLKELLRGAAIKTSRIWPFSAVSRAVYRQAIRAFRRLCRRHIEIEAAYVRNSFAQGHWTAGSSDIDLTVLLRGNLTPQAEFTFLSRFWAERGKLMRLFPMLGEVDVLTEEELPAFQGYGGSLSQPSAWLPIYGSAILSRHLIAPLDRSGIRALNDALWLYSERFLESLAQPRTFLRREHSARLARKIIRLCGASAGLHPKPSRAAAPPDSLPTDPLPADPWLLAGHVQHAMENAARFLMADEDRELDRDRLAPFGPCFPLSSENIACACTSYDGRDFVILRDGLDPAAFASSLRVDQAFWKTRAQPPVFLSRPLAAYFLRVARPFFLAGLQSAGAVSFGESLLPLIPEPTDASLRNVLLEQVPNLLLLPRSAAFFEAGSALNTPHQEEILLRLTVTALAAQGALPTRNYQTLEALARRHDSPAFERLRQISSLAPDSFPQEVFRLYRSISASLARQPPEFSAEAGSPPSARPVRIAIVGSCATAGAFAYPCAELREVFCRVGTSLIGLSAPIPESESQETIIAALVRTQPDVIVFDFMDEPFDLLSSAPSFAAGHPHGQLEPAAGGQVDDRPSTVPRQKCAGFASVDPHANRLPSLWKPSALTAATRIREALPAVRFVIHRAFWAAEFVRELEHRRFGGELMRESAQRNRSLAEAYCFFEESVAGVTAVQPAVPLRAFAHHRAGLRPCHYTPEYDQAFLNELVQRLRLTGSGSL